MNNEKMTVLVVEPGMSPYVKEIDSGLKSLQSEVGGWIEAVYPFEEEVALILNEEGKLYGLPLNRALCDEDGDAYDVVAGTFLVVGLGEEDFCSLSDEYIEKFYKRFEIIEEFVEIDGKIVVTRLGNVQQVLGGEFK